jgi:hypothetical protein
MAENKFDAAIKEAYKKALKIVEECSPPDAHVNAKIVAAAKLVHLLLALDLDDE